MKRKILSIIALLVVMVALTGAASAASIDLTRNGTILGNDIPVKSNDNFNLGFIISAIESGDNGSVNDVTATLLSCTDPAPQPVTQICNLSDLQLNVLTPFFNVTQTPVQSQANALQLMMNVPISRKAGTAYSFLVDVGPFTGPPGGPATNPDPASASRVILLVGGFISGTKFNDADNNGIRGATEPGLPGWTIILRDQNGTEVNRTTTDANGNYIFKGPTVIDPTTGNLINVGFRGNFTVEEVPQAGWTQTAPAPIPPGKYNVSIDANNVTGLDFGNRQVLSISGMKFNDLNGDGIKGTTEPGLANWTIVLTKPDGTTVSTTTDANGNYTFSNLTAGTYTVSEVLQAGWNQTFPTPVPPGTHTVTLTTVSVTDRDFGNHKIEEGHPGKCIGWGNLKNPSAKFNIFAFTPNKFSGPQGTVEFEQGGISIKSTQIDSVNSSADKTSCTITGLATVNSSSIAVAFRVDIEDHGSSGDMFGIDMRPGNSFFRLKEVLSSGNLKIIK